LRSSCQVLTFIASTSAWRDRRYYGRVDTTRNCFCKSVARAPWLVKPVTCLWDISIQKCEANICLLQITNPQNLSALRPAHIVASGRTDGQLILHYNNISKRGARWDLDCAGASAINTLHLIDSFNYSSLIYVNPFRSCLPGILLAIITWEATSIDKYWCF
jgi:hypothetical protein